MPQNGKRMSVCSKHYKVNLVSNVLVSIALHNGRGNKKVFGDTLYCWKLLYTDPSLNGTFPSHFLSVFAHICKQTLLNMEEKAGLISCFLSLLLQNGTLKYQSHELKQLMFALFFVFRCGKSQLDCYLMSVFWALCMGEDAVVTALWDVKFAFDAKPKKNY